MLRDYIVNKILPRRGSVLDLGCGTGKLLIEAGRRGLRGVGIDTNAKMLEIAKENSKKHNLSRRLDFRLGNVTALELDNDSFDLVVSSLVVSELQPEEVGLLFSEAARVGVSGGWVVIGTEGLPKGRTIGRFFSLIRRLSYMVVSRLSRIRAHPVHEIAPAMRSAGLAAKYRVQFLGGLLELYVAEVIE